MVRDMTRGKPMGHLMTLAMSVLVSGLMTYIYNATDGIMTAYYVDKTALGAISALSPIYVLISGFLSSFASGFAILAGRVLGAGDRAHLRGLMANATLLMTVIVVPVTLLCIVFAHPLALLMQVPAVLRKMAVTYFIITASALPIHAVSWVCGSMFRAMGDSKSPMVIGLCCGALNVGFNFLFLAIIPLGIAGAALGTACAGVVGAVVYIVALKKKMEILHFHREDLHFSRPLVRGLLSNGIPMGLLSSVINLGSLILQVAINSLGNVSAITGISTGGQVMNIVWHFIVAFESALIYFCAQNVGAGQLRRVRTGFRSASLTTALLAGIVALICFFFGKAIYRLYIGGETSAEAEAIVHYANQYVRTQLLFFPFMMGVCLPRGVLKGIGNTLPTVLYGVIELVGRTTVSVLAICLSISTEEKIRLLYLAGPMAWVGGAVFLLILLPRSLKKAERIHETEKARQ